MHTSARRGPASIGAGRCQPAARVLSNCTNAADSHGDPRHGARHAQGMDEPTQDDLFLDAVDAIVLDALATVGDDPRARFAFIKRLLAVAQEVAKERGQ